jgi:MFS family permease
LKNSSIRYDDNLVPTNQGRTHDASARQADGGVVVRALFAILCYQGYAFSILGVAAPFLARSFALDQSAIARMYAWISVNSLGALILSRMADRVGRRRIVLLSLIITPCCSLGAALATRPSVFIMLEILVYAGIGATFGSALVMVAEALPTEKRSEGQGWANLATAAGGGGCVLLAPILVHFGLSWRWMLVVPVVGIVLLPIMARMLPESWRWELVVVGGKTESSHFYDIFGSAYRGRAIPLIIATILGEASGAAVATWVYYHAVTVVHLSAAQASAVLFFGGALGILV